MTKPSGERYVKSWSVSGLFLPDGEQRQWWVQAGLLRGEPVPDAEPLPGRFVLAGLVDAHCHLALEIGPHGPRPLQVGQATANLRALTSQGVLAVRDTGGPPGVVLALRPGPEDPLLLGCGRFLSTPRQYFPDVYEPVPPAQLLAAAEHEAAAGARWLKLVGDFPVDLEAPARPTYALELVRELVDRAHSLGVRVAAHTTTTYASGLVAAGVDSIEHGPLLTLDDLRSLGARSGAWTPTLGAVLAADDSADEDRQRRRSIAEENLRELLPQAAAAGVTVLTGSDVVGNVPSEVAWLVQCGLSPEDALAAATTAARTYLGLPTLTAGSSADLVTYAQDPRNDPEVLRTPAAVLRAGRRVV